MKFRIPLLLILVGAIACGEISMEDSTINEAKSGQSAEVLFDYYNDPLRMDPTFTLQFDQLPLAGQLPVTPWTDTYWPRNKGGIGYRWRTDESHTYQTIPYDQALGMSEEALAHLSPAEKYDLYVGNRDYALTARMQAENSATATSWQGYCHGWTMASIHFDEPRPVVMENPDGLRIPFGSSDIKALLTYFQGEVVSAERYSENEIPFKQSITSVGTTCRSADPNDESCSDTNPGAFHIVMANMIGLRGQAFGIDATTTAEKWNQPVHTYQSRLVERRQARSNAKPGVVQEVIIETKFVYTAEIDPQWETTNFTSLHSDHEKTVSYRLDLDAAGNIVDGEWILFVEGGHYTFQELYDYYAALDENGDGLPDLDKDQVKANMWHFFEFPDYVWYQDRGEFSQTFVQAESSYTLQFNSVSTRKAVYNYLSKLADLYQASLQ